MGERENVVGLCLIQEEGKFRKKPIAQIIITIALSDFRIFVIKSRECSQ